MKKHAFRFVALVVAVLSLGLLQSTRGQDTARTYTEIKNQGQKAHSIPISENTIRVEVRLSSSEKPTTLLIQEGAMAKIGNLQEGYAYALVPFIRDFDKKSVQFTVFRLSQDKDGNESVEELERLDADGAGASTTVSEPKMQVKVVAVERPKAGLSSTPGQLAIPDKPNPKIVMGAKSDCSVNCLGIWACATCVWMSCGCCYDSPYSCHNPNESERRANESSCLSLRLSARPPAAH